MLSSGDSKGNFREGGREFSEKFGNVDREDFGVALTRLALSLLERPFFFPELGGIFAIKRSVGSHLDKALTGFDKSLHLLMFFFLSFF